MASGVLGRAVRDLRRAACPGDAPDGELLERYVAARDEAAFEALVRRHGPTVLGVCRRVLRHEADAEDAFQAAFLILAHRAPSIRRSASVGSWLYGVAHRVALKARAVRRRRRSEEAAAGRLAKSQADAGPWRDVQALVDAELLRLPDKYRAAILLCGVEGKTVREAAARLGWPQGTVATRLARGRALLARRLARHGLTLSAVAASGLPGEAAASAVPAALVSVTVRAARPGAPGQAAVPSGVASLAEGVLKAMSRTKLTLTAALLLGFTLVVAGATALALRPAGAPSPPQKAPPGSGAGRAEAPDREATRLALRAHAQAAAIDKLPRFTYRVRYRHGVVDSMRAIDVTPDRLRQGLTAPVLAKDWVGWYETRFCWDEKRFLWQLRPRDADLNYSTRFWTAGDAWDRAENKAKTSVQFVRFAGPAKLWGKHIHLFDYGYLRLTPHRYWWGRTAADNDQTMNLVPPAEAAWKHLGVEPFAGEPCAVVESAQRAERLWVSRASGRVRGVLSFRFTGYPGDETFYRAAAVTRIAGKPFASRQDYSDWLREASYDQRAQIGIAWSRACAAHFPASARPNELVQFDDYREVAPGVWLPFREVRTFPHASEIAGNKSLLRRSELVVEDARADRSLAAEYARLLPREGERVQDQRFLAPVDYPFRAGRSDDDIRRAAEAAYREALKGQELFRKLVRPLEALVGKPAPALPADGWVGGNRPDVAGKPYLLHFWAAWCGPCKADVPRLKALAEQGVIIVGMHPAGTPAGEVEKAHRAHGLGFATHLAAGKAEGAKGPAVGGYPVGVFPYYVLVDARGRVAAHGFLGEVVGQLQKASSGSRERKK